MFRSIFNLTGLLLVATVERVLFGTPWRNTLMMPTIPVVEAADSKGICLCVLPDGSMSCYLDDLILEPVPPKAREWALLNLGQEGMPPGTPNRVLIEAGLAKAISVAPAQFELPYDAIKQEMN